MKVSELPREEIDRLIARMEGREIAVRSSGLVARFLENGPMDWRPFSPTTNPADSWAIIEREIRSMHCDGGKMRAVTHDGSCGWGATYLEAACRAIVASKFGPEVPDEKEQ